ncbi:hypothetical protein SFUMM280S_09919 [Streptomyces fumanus]
MTAHPAERADPRFPDLADPRTFIDTDLPALWRTLRAEAPVHWNPPAEDRPGFWAVTRYEDVLAVYKDNRRFTSEQGNVLSTLLQGGDSAAGKMLAVTDGPRHRETRKLMLKSRLEVQLVASPAPGRPPPPPRRRCACSPPSPRRRPPWTRSPDGSLQLNDGARRRRRRGRAARGGRGRRGLRAAQAHAGRRVPQPGRPLGRQRLTPVSARRYFQCLVASGRGEDEEPEDGV